MDGWYVQVSRYEEDGWRSILLCGKGYRQQLQLQQGLVVRPLERLRITLS